MTFTREGFVPVSQPRALRDDELPAVIASTSTPRVCDGRRLRRVEVHARTPTCSSSSCATRSTIGRVPTAEASRIARRLTLEVMQAVATAIGAGRTGIRLSR